MSGIATQAGMLQGGAGEQIVTSGLILHLDAGDSNSYSGSGTTWTDLSGNSNNGTLVNGTTYISSNGGVFDLDGINDYISIPNVDLRTNNYTVMGASRYVTVGGRVISALDNNWFLGHQSGNVGRHQAGIGGWIANGFNNVSVNYVSDTNWRIYTATSDYNSDSWAFYVNGQLERGPNSGGVEGPNGFGIGQKNGGGERSNSQISFLLCYDRVLTSAEITQNFNAFKDRFGL